MTTKINKNDPWFRINTSMISAAMAFLDLQFDDNVKEELEQYIREHYRKENNIPAIKEFLMPFIGGYIGMIKNSLPLIEVSSSYDIKVEVSSGRYCREFGDVAGYEKYYIEIEFIIKNDKITVPLKKVFFTDDLPTRTIHSEEAL